MSKVKHIQIRLIGSTELPVGDTHGMYIMHWDWDCNTGFKLVPLIVLTMNEKSIFLDLRLNTESQNLSPELSVSDIFLNMLHTTPYSLSHAQSQYMVVHLAVGLYLLWLR